MPRERVYRIVEREIEKDGKVKVLIYARTSYTDRQGQRHTLWRSGENRTEAKQRLKDALDDILKSGDEVRSRTTFAELVDFYRDRYVKPAKYKGDMKVEGLRSFKQVSSQIKPLVAHFGRMKLRSITHEDIRIYKQKRLAEPYYRGTDEAGEPIERERATASVNRELSLLRKMLNVAVRQRWIVDSPFPKGDSLISLAGEVQRQRILTKEEEERIFAACEQDERRKHLKPILMCLMDTGMRRNEVLRLTWADVDLERGTLLAVSFKGKQRTERIIGTTKRLQHELRSLYEQSGGAPDGLVFGVTGDIKRSWTTVRRLASLPDVRLHDLRHQAATNFIRSGLSLEETGKLLGHSEPKTTWRYVNIDTQTALDAARLLDKMRGEGG